MGIQCPRLPSVWQPCRMFFNKISKEFYWFKAHSPLTPKSYVPYSVALGSGAASFGGTSSVCFIGHEPAAAGAYSDILPVQYPDRLCLVVFLKPSQKLTAANQVPAYGNQLTLVLVA